VNGVRCEGFQLRASAPAVSWIVVKLPAQAGGENVGVLPQLSCTRLRLVWKSFAACRKHRYRFIRISPLAVTLVICINCSFASYAFATKVATFVESSSSHGSMTNFCFLKYPQAANKDLDTRAGRGIDLRLPTSLALGDWVEAGYSLPISGATGAGKSWLACALTQYACRRGHSALYQRVPRLGEELRVLYGNGGFTKRLLQVARTDVLLLVDWGMAPIDAMVRNDLLEMIDDCSAGKATIVTSQLPM